MEITPLRKSVGSGYRLLIITMLISSSLFSQHSVLKGVGADFYSSGNGHGTLLSPYASLEYDRNTVHAGPVIQGCKVKPVGMRVLYSRSVTGERSRVIGNNFYLIPRKDILEMSFFGFAQYLHNLTLCEKVAADEKTVAYNREVDYDNLRLNTAEAGAGISLQLNFTNRLTWKNYIAISVFHHLNYVQGMNHERTHTVLTLGTGIQFNFE